MTDHWAELQHLLHLIAMEQYCCAGKNLDITIAAMTTARERFPDIYIERDEDTRKRQRRVPLEVLSLGYSRTGTMSLS